MKKIAFLLFLMTIIAFSTYAQEPQYTSDLPIDKSTGLITYEAILDADGDADELFKRAQGWFNEFYPNPRVVIQEVDNANGKIVGKHKFRLQIKNEKGVPTDAGFIKYTIKVWVKDGKYRYRISDINLENITYFGVEEWMKDGVEDKISAQKKLAAIDKFMNELIQDLQKGMLPEEVKPDEDEW